ncbi:MAG: hypoxanthine phosphoribosyltransferase [Candidatus Alcyoniella australis]|nr:hypoxanthine phosphoribosyltransferase [Candidatus Alcyoniella australis]
MGLIKIKDAEQIAQRVAQLAQRIDAMLTPPSDPPPLMVVVLKGAFVFAADLLRAMDTPCAVDFMRAASYGNATSSSGEVRITLEPEVALEGRSVLLVDDICDSGRTMLALSNRLRELGAQKLICCALFDKRERREVLFEPELIGFEVGDHFIVGYGLDHAEAMRHLDGVYYLEA